MKQYKFVNNLVGWITFLIAATVYCLTIEPTASFWDCPEFSTTGYKLEVGHPPGAPFFMLVANFFSLFASGPSEVARMVNYMSALMSGACILFLFWSITHLVRKLVIKDENHITRGQMVTIMGSGPVGAPGLYVQRHVLVLGRRGRGIRVLVAVHRHRVLADIEVGRRGRPASQRPLAHPDSLPDGT